MDNHVAEQTPEKEIDKQVYNNAIQQLINKNQNSNTVINYMVDNGVERDEATVFINDCLVQIDVAKKESAKKDILYGALWCVGGTVATLANIGFIFWGAIVFGGIQLIRGLINYSK